MTKKISVTIENRSSCLVESKDVESMTFSEGTSNRTADYGPFYGKT